jgi:hypothetical protein
VSLLNFPDSPTTGDVYSFGNRAWRYNGRAWEAYPAVMLDIADLSVGGSLSVFGALTLFDGDFNLAGDLNIPDGGLSITGALNLPDGDFNLTGDLNISDGDLNLTGDVNVTGDLLFQDENEFSLTLQVVTPTANRTITFPDATGTVGLVGGSSGNLIFNLGGAYAGVTNSLVDNTTGNITLGSRFISSLNGAASAPPGAFTGTWFTGGTATTTKPQVLIEPTGTTSTAWSTSGTGLGVNAASGFDGRLLDLQVNGTSLARISAAGAITGSSINTAGAIAGSSISASNYFVTGAIEIGAGSRVTNGRFGSNSTGIVGWTAGNAWDSDDLVIRRDTANTLAQRNGTNAQTYRLYNTFTSATNFERLNFRWTTNEAIIDTEAGSGGGTLRGLKIGSAGTSLLGFYGATPVVQPAAVADITTTATTGTLPTPDGSVTVADADAPTVTELLEYCVELEAKLEAALGHLRTLGLIAT